MSVQDRICEHAVLQTLGLRPARIFRLVIAESLLMCLLGGALGTGLALAVLTCSSMAVGAEGVTIAFRASWRLGASGVAVSLLVGVLAGFIPAWQTARAQIVTALRHV
jgi:putative ABC transport system permease protein